MRHFHLPSNTPLKNCRLASSSILYLIKPGIDTRRIWKWNPPSIHKPPHGLLRSCNSCTPLKYGSTGVTYQCEGKSQQTQFTLSNTSVKRAALLIHMAVLRAGEVTSTELAYDAGNKIRTALSDSRIAAVLCLVDASLLVDVDGCCHAIFWNLSGRGTLMGRAMTVGFSDDPRLNILSRYCRRVLWLCCNIR